MPARVLILTAAFGEGHNSAARNLRLALAELGAETEVADPCRLGAPVTTDWLCRGYRWVTTYAPRLWHRIYRHTGDVDFSRQRMPLMRKPERRLAGLIESFRPDAIVTTYPLYPYFLERLFADTDSHPPVFTVVTDSIEINSAWLRSPCHAWLVTDPATREAMIRGGIGRDQVVDTGFAVDPAFSRLTPLAADAPLDPFDVLYFATPKLPHVRRISKAVLHAAPATRITIVLGRNVRLLYRRAREIKDRFPGRVRIKGWTRQVPQLLASHHLVIGKAGGATVHEALAANCPMLVHHLVPGQEEGNLALLRQIDGGNLAAGPEAIQRELRDLLADQGARWRAMKRALARHGRHAGALAAARHILAHTPTSPPP